MIMFKRAVVTAVALGGLLTFGGVYAQEFPTKTVKIITPFPAGGGPEGVLRVLADSLSKMWGKPVIVENKPGANGFLAIGQVKAAAPDGHELLQMDTSQMATYQTLFKKLPYDVNKDFEPILPLFKNAFMVVVASDSPYKSVKDIIEDAKRRPDRVNFGSWSIGNPVHIASAMVESGTGTKMTHVPYKETTQLYAGVANKDVDWAFGSVATAGALERAGKLRYLATSAGKRESGLPNVPTAAESGGPADFDYTAWTALVAPKGVPAAVVDKIHRDVTTALNTPEMKAKYAALFYDGYPMTRTQFGDLLKRESERNGVVVKRLNVQLD
jgi:tripartite-type tricarboxylate transporter receptor subunit TctC